MMKPVNVLAGSRCVIYLIHMLNILSFILGLISLVIVIPATIPLLGWANWFALPIIVLGIIVGAMSSSNRGRNFCLIVGLIAVIRLSLGGGLI